MIRGMAERLTMSIREAAETLGISESMAYKMAGDGRLPVTRFGRRVLVPKDAVRDLALGRPLHVDGPGI